MVFLYKNDRNVRFVLFTKTSNVSKEKSNALQIVPFENIGNLNICSYPWGKKSINLKTRKQQALQYKIAHCNLQY